jgi:predicted transcriptional regulator
MAKVKEQSVAYKTSKPAPASKKLASAKKSTMTLLKRLPNDVTYEDIMYELYVLEKIERGLRELDEGRGIPHEEVKKSLSKWLR